jgi:hypothetical protein
VLTGHVALALAARGARSSIPLWVLILASQLPDWADAAVCATRLSPAVQGLYSHSIVATVTLATAAAVLAYTQSRDFTGALLIGVLVMSHTLGDYVTGIKPTWSGGPTIGLHLYSRPLLDFLFEGVILLAAFLFYRRSFPPEIRNSGRVLAVPAMLLAIQAGADIVFALSPGLQKC